MSLDTSHTTNDIDVQSIEYVFARHDKFIDQDLDNNKESCLANVSFVADDNRVRPFKYHD